MARKLNQVLQEVKIDPFCLMILWHSTFMSLYADFSRLECACGREGEDFSLRDRVYAQTWARSEDAKRCLLHAALIQRHFQSMPIGTEPAIHVPMALYYCGIAWTSYTRFADRIAFSMSEGETNLQYSEMRLIGINETKLFVEALAKVESGRPDSSPFFKVIDMLGRITHWKIASSLASTLLVVIEDSEHLF